MAESRRTTPRTHAQRQRSGDASQLLLDELRGAGLAVEPIDSASVLVAGRFVMMPGAGFWRAKDGSAHGYSLRRLIQLASGKTENRCRHCKPPPVRWPT